MRCAGKGPRLGFVTLALALFCLASSDGGAGTISPDLEKTLTSQGSEKEVAVIVYLKEKADMRRLHEESGAAAKKSLRRHELVRTLKELAETTQLPVRTLMESRRAKNIRPLWVTNGIAFSAPATVIREIAARPEVDRLATDTLVSAPSLTAGIPAAWEWNLDLIRAPMLWNSGYTGQGVVVASMDTGVDVLHPDLSGSWRGGTNSWYDPNGEHMTPADVNGHGTMTMGVIAGGDAGGTSVGVAPGVKWIAVKIFNDSGTASFSAIHQGFQWLLDPDGNPATDDAPDVVNNSWGLEGAGALNQCLTEFETDVQALKAAGIALTFSAGNNGPGSSTSASPANYPESMAVGALNQALDIASGSSRGPSACGGTVFPGIVAPGVNIRTTALTYGGAVPDSYAYVSGTSISAPHVAGAMALLLSAFPDLQPSQMEQALTATALDLGVSGADNVYGHGLIDAAAAYTALGGTLESISRPSAPTGPAKGGPGVSYTFSTNGSVSSLGDPVQYLIDWGDGTDSGWLPEGTLSASRSWTAGTYTVRARARCTVHQVIISPWSTPAAISVSVPVTVTVNSGFWQDGRVVESKTAPGTGASAFIGGIVVGDDGRDRQQKGILSFDTSKIPVSAEILSATLKLTRARITNTNPFTIFGTCSIDVMKGTFNKKGLERTDFEAAATASGALVISDPLINNGVAVTALGQAAMNAINKGGITQMRLSFPTPTNNDKRADYITFYSGGSARSRRPALEVTYLP